MTNLKQSIKKSWNWIWHSDSIFSWIVALLLIFLIVKYIFFPTLSLIMGTVLPLAGVESSSMDHQMTKDDKGNLGICGNLYLKDEKQYLDFDEYWETCGDWYEENQITQEQFSEFSLKNGFKKGDIIIVWGRFQPKIGDIIIFQANKESRAPRPIIHRIVSMENNTIESRSFRFSRYRTVLIEECEFKVDDDLSISNVDSIAIKRSTVMSSVSLEEVFDHVIMENNTIQTKGDHNEVQLTGSNNIYHTDETTITQDRIIGKAVFKIPYLGWVKIWFVEFFQKIF